MCCLTRVCVPVVVDKVPRGPVRSGDAVDEQQECNVPQAARHNVGAMHCGREVGAAALPSIALLLSVPNQQSLTSTPSAS